MSFFIAIFSVFLFCLIVFAIVFWWGQFRYSIKFKYVDSFQVFKFNGKCYTKLPYENGHNSIDKNGNTFEFEEDCVVLI